LTSRREIRVIRVAIDITTEKNPRHSVSFRVIRVAIDITPEKKSAQIRPLRVICVAINPSNCHWQPVHHH
jgi:hypothetical protein